MAICTELDNAGRIVQDTVNTDPLNCPGYVLPNGQEYLAYWIASPIEITPEQILYVFSWGFGAVLSFWVIGYIVGLAIKLISKV